MGFGADKPDQVANIIHVFVKRVPNAGRTQLVKFLYLMDLAGRQYHGEQVTDLEYIWHTYGPFDSRIYAKLTMLSEAGVIREIKVRYPTNKEGYRYVAKGEPPASLSTKVADLVDYVVREYGHMSLDSLLRHVYRTPPMLEAKRLNARGKLLKMNLVENQIALLASIKKGADQLRRGEKVAFSRVYQRIKAKRG